MTDDEKLAKVITDSLQQVQKYFDDDDVPVEKACRALDSVPKVGRVQYGAA